MKPAHVKSKKYVVGVQLDSATLKFLDEEKQRRGLSRSDIIRMAIQARYAPDQKDRGGNGTH